MQDKPIQPLSKDYKYIDELREHINYFSLNGIHITFIDAFDDGKKDHSDLNTIYFPLDFQKEKKPCPWSGASQKQKKISLSRAKHYFSINGNKFEFDQKVEGRVIDLLTFTNETIDQINKSLTLENKIDLLNIINKYSHKNYQLHSSHFRINPDPDAGMMDVSCLIARKILKNKQKNLYKTISCSKNFYKDQNQLRLTLKYFIDNPNINIKLLINGGHWIACLGRYDQETKHMSFLMADSLPDTYNLNLLLLESMIKELKEHFNVLSYDFYLSQEEIQKDTISCATYAVNFIENLTDPMVAGIEQDIFKYAAAHQTPNPINPNIKDCIMPLKYKLTGQSLEIDYENRASEYLIENTFYEKARFSGVKIFSKYRSELDQKELDLLNKKNVPMREAISLITSPKINDKAAAQHQNISNFLKQYDNKTLLSLFKNCIILDAHLKNENETNLMSDFAHLEKLELLTKNKMATFFSTTSFPSENDKEFKESSKDGDFPSPLNK